MTLFAHYQPETGEITGFYNDTRHDDIPQPNLEISEADWRRQINGEVIWRVDVTANAPGLFEYTAPPRPREEQREAALRLIDAEHAHWLELLTGGATVAERDTWKAKEEAARAYLADTATPGQAAMIATEAEGTKITETALAEKIVAKADTFLTLIGIAAGIRARSRAAIMAATADDVPPDQVETRIAVALDTLKSEAEAAAAKFQAQKTQTEEA